MVRRQPALAKLSRPRLHDVLARTRLYALLDGAVQLPVVWLSAQPGAGKTMLVASWLQARKRGGIWYQIDAADADPASFVYHLRLALQAHAGAKAGDELPLLTPEYLRDLAGFARRLFRTLFARLGDDATLVFDNFQEAGDDAALHRLLVDGLAEVPEGVNVIVISRNEPPAPYAPLLANNAIALLDGVLLRLSVDETEAIARKRGWSDPAAMRSLQERCNGWAAGLTLLLMRGQAHAEHADDDADSLQHVFGYFAQRVFDASADADRRALMALSFAPQITTALAEQLTGRADIGRLLESHYKRRMFTERRRAVAEVGGDGVGAAAPAAQAGPVYQFHALFRVFLQHQARSALAPDELRATLRRSAQALAAAGQWEAALALYADAGDWSAYASAVVAHAERALEQGRRQSVVDWIARVPAAARDADPWLGYWEGRAHGPVAAERALQALQRSLDAFAARADALGQLACGAAAVQTLWYARLGWSEIGAWADRLEPLLGSEPAFPSPAMELFTYSALHAAISFCRLAHPSIPAMAQRLLGLVGSDAIGWDQRLLTATHLITYFHNASEHEHATQLIAKVDTAVEALPSSALNRAFWYVFRAIHDIRLANYDAAAQRFQRAEGIARDDGLVHAEFAAVLFRAYLDTMFRRADEAGPRIARLEVHGARGHPDAEMNLAMLQTLFAQLSGDGAAALAHARRGLQAVDAVQAEYFRAVYPPVMASALVDAGETDEALAIVERSRALVHGSYLEIMSAQLLCEEAYARLARGEREAALACLAEGLAQCAADRARAGYAHRILARKPLLVWTAFEAGIETAFLSRLVRQWHIEPPAHDLPGWPWPIKVRTLGGFEVRVDDEPIAFGRKAPKKTLALLKAVIARGGVAAESALLDTFWPDEEGDTAARSLGAAVHRLRGLLGDADAIVQQGGKLSIDRTRVWVDAWAFDAAPRDTLALYGGAFLVEEEGEAWPVAMRERLRSKFVQAVAEHGTALEKAHRDEEAIAWYLRGLEADSVVEPFYQGLMRCYHRLDRLPEAVSAYRRLKQTLSVILSLPPSDGTEKLYRTLRLG